MLIKDIINETTSAGGIATVVQPMTKKVIKRKGPVEKGKIKIGKGIYSEDQVPFLKRPTSGYAKAIADYLKQNPGKTEEDFKELGVKQQEKYLNKYVEGKSPHKKGTKKYKKHMAAMHAG